MDKKKRILLLVASSTIVIIIVGLIIFTITNKSNNYFGKNNNEDNENIEDNAGEIIEEPTTDSLQIGEIQGFIPEANYDSSSNSETGEGDIEEVTSSDPYSIIIPYTIPGTSLTIESIGQYTGPFIEDGSDEPKANLISIVVKNNSDKLLQYAQINIKINDSQDVIFNVSTLPAGTSAVVLESTGLVEFKDGDTYKYVDSINTYLDETSLMEDKIEITKSDSKLIIKNNSNEDLGTVYVYYKYIQQGGAYLGGITYRSKFENVSAGSTVKVDAKHFSESSSKILMVDYIN